MNKIFLIFLLFSSVTLADCPKSINVEWVISQIDDQHFDLKLAKEAIGRYSGLIKDAGKPINPEIEHYTSVGPTGQHTYAQSESRLWMTWMTANKKLKRSMVWQNQQQIEELTVEILKRELYKTALNSILRIKQLKEEMSWYRDINRAVTDGIKRYETLKILGPQQEIEKEIFLTMATENRVREHNLGLELHGLQYELKLLTGFACKTNDLQINSSSAAFPDPLTVKGNLDESSNLVHLEKLKAENIHRQWVREEAMAYPDVKWGPITQYNSNGNQYVSSATNNFYGLMAVIPIPVLDTNKGLRQSKLLEYEIQQKKLILTVTRQTEFLNHLIEEYEHLYQSYKETNKIDSIKAKTNRYIQALGRGLITIPSFLEFLRQVSVSIDSYHMLERRNFAQLMDIYDLQQKFELNNLIKVVAP